MGVDFVIDITPYDLEGGLDMSVLKQRHNGNTVDAKVLTAYPNCGGLQNMGSVPDSPFPARVWLCETIFPVG